ncbi:hypothetical protein WJX82_002362 [Trebouxia sp. C0006]
MPDGVVDTATYEFEWTTPTTLLWDYYAPFHDCGTKQRVGGIGDGGKWVCEVMGALQHSECVVYSLGSHMETTFEEEIIEQTPCKVHTFDHSLSSEQGKTLSHVSPRLAFHPYKVGMGHSISAHYKEKSIHGIMEELNHSWIDVLKIDIEDAEWEVLEALISSGSLHFSQLQVEFHFRRVSLKMVLKVLAGLTDAGYRVFSTEPNHCCNGSHMEYSFIKVDSNGKPVLNMTLV